MPDIKLPKITIPTVDIPSVPYFTQNVLTGIKPACDLIDRDLEITQNPTIVFHNRKQYATCPEVFVQENTDTGSCSRRYPEVGSTQSPESRCHL